MKSPIDPRILLLDRLLVGYSLLPHHPGKGRVYDMLMPLVQSTWEAPRRRTRFGVSFECDLNDKVTREIYYTGFDRKDVRVLRQLVKPDDVVVDVGANVGYFSLLCAKWLHGRGVVHAFEPFNATRQRFRRNLELNPELDCLVHLHELALSDFTGTMRMDIPDPSNQGCNCLSTTGTANVNVTTLDDFCAMAGLTRIDLIKIDVEGSEVALMRGADQTIRRFRPVLMIEVNPSTLTKFGETAEGLIEAVCRYGYHLYYANRLGLKLLQRGPEYGEEPNIFAFPIELATGHPG